MSAYMKNYQVMYNLQATDDNASAMITSIGTAASETLAQLDKLMAQLRYVSRYGSAFNKDGIKVSFNKDAFQSSLQSMKTAATNTALQISKNMQAALNGTLTTDNANLTAQRTALKRRMNAMTKGLKNGALKEMKISPAYLDLQKSYEQIDKAIQSGGKLKQVVTKNAVQFTENLGAIGTPTQAANLAKMSESISSIAKITSAGIKGADIFFTSNMSSVVEQFNSLSTTIGALQKTQQITISVNTEEALRKIQAFAQSAGTALKKIGVLPSETGKKETKTDNETLAAAGKKKGKGGKIKELKESISSSVLAKDNTAQVGISTNIAAISSEWDAFIAKANAMKELPITVVANTEGALTKVTEFVTQANAELAKVKPITLAANQTKRGRKGQQAVATEGAVGAAGTASLQTSQPVQVPRLTKANQQAMSGTVKSFGRFTEMVNGMNPANLNATLASLEAIQKATAGIRKNISIRITVNSSNALKKLDRVMAKVNTLASNSNVTIGAGAAIAGEEKVTGGTSGRAKSYTGRVVGGAKQAPSLYDRMRKGMYPLTGNTSLGVKSPMMVDMAKGMGTMFAISGAMSAIGNAFSQSIEYQNTMRTTRAILENGNGQFSNDSFKEMEKTVRNVGIKTKFSAPEVADAARFMAMAGYDIPAINAAIRPVSDVALIGDTELGETADKLTNVMTTFNIVPDKMRDMADIMTSTFTRSNTDMMMLAESAKYAGGITNLYGRLNPNNFADFMAMVGVLGNAGIQASSAGTTIRMMYQNLMQPNKKQKAVMQKYGISTRDASGNPRAMIDIIEQIVDKIPSSALSDAIGQMFRITAQPGAGALATHIDMLHSLMIANRNAAGSGISQKISEEKQNTIHGLWAQVTSTFTEGILKAFELKSNGFAEYLKKIRDYLASPKTVKALASLLDLVEMLLKTIGAFANFWAKIYHMIPGILNFWLRAQLFFTQIGYLLVPVQRIAYYFSILQKAIIGHAAAVSADAAATASATTAMNLAAGGAVPARMAAAGVMAGGGFMSNVNNAAKMMKASKAARALGQTNKAARYAAEATAFKYMAFGLTPTKGGMLGWVKNLVGSLKNIFVVFSRFFVVIGILTAIYAVIKSIYNSRKEYQEQLSLLQQDRDFLKNIALSNYNQKMSIAEEISGMSPVTIGYKKDIEENKEQLTIAGIKEAESIKQLTRLSSKDILSHYVNGYKYVDESLILDVKKYADQVNEQKDVLLNGPFSESKKDKSTFWEKIVWGFAQANRQQNSPEQVLADNLTIINESEKQTNNKARQLAMIVQWANVATQQKEVLSASKDLLKAAYSDKDLQKVQDILNAFKPKAHAPRMSQKSIDQLYSLTNPEQYYEFQDAQYKFLKDILDTILPLQFESKAKQLLKDNPNNITTQLMDQLGPTMLASSQLYWNSKKASLPLNSDGHVDWKEFARKFNEGIPLDPQQQFDILSGVFQNLSNDPFFSKYKVVLDLLEQYMRRELQAPADYVASTIDLPITLEEVKNRVSEIKAITEKIYGNTNNLPTGFTTTIDWKQSSFTNDAIPFLSLSQSEQKGWLDPKKYALEELQKKYGIMQGYQKFLEMYPELNPKKTSQSVTISTKVNNGSDVQQDPYKNTYDRNASRPTQVIVNIDSLAKFDRTSIGSGATAQDVENMIMQRMGMTFTELTAMINETTHQVSANAGTYA